jgi:RNA polymerase sigma factor (sigma-70 family)
VAALALAALAGANALLLVALVVVLCGRPLRALAATAVLSLPWVVPGLLQHVAAGDRAGVAAFAARSDTPLGVLGSLLTGGGVWASEAVPPGRSAGMFVAVLVLVVAGVGLPRLRARLGDGLLVAAAVGLLLALLGRLPLLADGLRWAVVHVPSAGLLRDGQSVVSLDAPADPDDRAALERIADTTVADPEATVVTRSLQQVLEESLACLDEREAQILRMRFGLGGGEARPLRAIAAEWHMSPEGVRQISERAMSHLRSMVTVRALSVYLEE